MYTKHHRAAPFAKAAGVKLGNTGMENPTIRQVVGKVLRDPIFWGPMAATGAMMATSQIHGAIHRAREAKARAQAYKDMLDLHPHLKQRDQAHIGRVYSSIYNMNPQMAKDPLIAGTLVDNVVESDAMYQGRGSPALWNLAKDLVGVRNNLSQSLQREGSPSQMAGARAHDVVMGLTARAREVHKEVGELGRERARNTELLQRLHTGKHDVDLYRQDLQEQEAQKARKDVERAFSRAEAKGLNKAQMESEFYRTLDHIRAKYE